MNEGCSSDYVTSAAGIFRTPLSRVILWPRPLAVIGCAVLLTTVLDDTSANISESVVGRIVRRGTGAWSWLNIAGLDRDVAHVELWPVARAVTLVVPQPGGVTTPVRDHEAHAVRDVVAHIIKVRAVSCH